MVVVGPPLRGGGRTRMRSTRRWSAALAGASVRDAAAEVAARLDLPRRQVYARALELAKRP